MVSQLRRDSLSRADTGPGRADVPSLLVALAIAQGAPVRVVYVAAPLSAPTRKGMDANRARGARWVAWAAGQGFAPVATWIPMSAVLAETEQNRALGLRVDVELVSRCDAVWLVGGRVSAGMKHEADHARGLGIPVIDLTYLGPEPPSGSVVLREPL